MMKCHLGLAQVVVCVMREGIKSSLYKKKNDEDIVEAEPLKLISCSAGVSKDFTDLGVIQVVGV